MCENPIAAVEHLAAPAAEGLRVMDANIADRLHNELRAATCGLKQAPEAGQMPTWKDVFLNPVRVGSIGVIPLIRDDDRLKHEEAFRGEQLLALGEEAVQEGMSDRLDHLDGDDAIEGVRSDPGSR